MFIYFSEEFQKHARHVDTYISDLMAYLRVKHLDKALAQKQDDQLPVEKSLIL